MALFLLIWTVAFDEQSHQSPEWISANKDALEDLGAYANFTSTIAHHLHMMCAEDFKYFFDVNIPLENGIPTTNDDLSVDDSDGVLQNVPSCPTSASTPGFHTFVRYMDNIDNPMWGMQGNHILQKLGHAFHMLDVWKKARIRANSFKAIPDSLCEAVLDTKNNGVNNALQHMFQVIKYKFNETFIESELGLPPLTDKPSWDLWKPSIEDSSNESYGNPNASGLFFHCIMKKFSDCNKKTVGGNSYTKVESGDCISNYIYERDDMPGSRYYFAPGDNTATCLP